MEERSFISDQTTLQYKLDVIYYKTNTSIVLDD